MLCMESSGHEPRFQTRLRKISSACNGWQPIEAERRLTRRCCELLLETRVYRLTQPVRDWDGLVTQITDNVAPTSWDEVGGPGSIAVLEPGALVVSQSYAAHRQLHRQFGNLLQPVVPEAPKAGKGHERALAAPFRSLDQLVTVEVNEAPLTEVIDFLAEQGRTKFAIDEKALQDCGLAPDIPASLRVGGVRLGCALDLLLRPLALTWVPDKQGLLITTPEEAEGKYLMQVTYEVRDMMMALQGDMDSLVEVITSTIMPASWSGVGGPGEIAPAAGGAALNVKQSFRAHRQLERLFSALRQVGRG